MRHGHAMVIRKTEAENKAKKNIPKEMQYQQSNETAKAEIIPKPKKLICITKQNFHAREIYLKSACFELEFVDSSYPENNSIIQLYIANLRQMAE